MAASSSSIINKPVPIAIPPRKESFFGKNIFKLGKSGKTSPTEERRPVLPPKGSRNALATLNSETPATELPATWDDFNSSYAQGLVDFDNPPPPPSKLPDSGMATSTGQHRAPRPLTETSRQRAVNNLNLVNREPTNRARKYSIDSDSSDDSAESHASASSTSSTSSAASSLVCPKPKEMSTHAGLQSLAERAKERFGSEVITVSLMDMDQQVFLAEVGLNVEQLPRESTICSHTMLKATTGDLDPLVVLDIGNDWRFEQNDFGKHSKGFYAAAPIMVPAAFGDPRGPQPAGIFCVLDHTPRGEFTEADKRDLSAMAGEAAAELAKHREETDRAQKLELATKRNEWKRRNKIVKKIAIKSPLDTVVEVMTPPTSPENEPSPKMAGPRRPSLARTYTSESAVSAIVTTEITPTFSKRGPGRVGLHASSQHRIAPEIRSMLDLSTRLVCESLDLDLVYLLAIDIPSGASASETSPMTSKRVRLLSSHNLPIPAPLFDVQLHIETLVSANNALLYSDPGFTGAEGEYATGLLVKVGSHDNTGYVLGGFSENPRRELNKQDFMFFRSFARDLQKYVTQLDSKASSGP